VTLAMVFSRTLIWYREASNAAPIPKVEGATPRDVTP